jgi:hypothetical protein
MRRADRPRTTLDLGTGSTGRRPDMGKKSKNKRFAHPVAAAAAVLGALGAIGAVTYAARKQSHTEPTA